MKVDGFIEIHTNMRADKIYSPYLMCTNEFLYPRCAYYTTKISATRWIHQTIEKFNLELTTIEEVDCNCQEEN